MYGYKEQKGDQKAAQKLYKRHTDALSGDWLTVYKYKLAAFYAAWKDNITLPTTPFSKDHDDKPRFLLGGRAGRFLKSILSRQRSAGQRQMAASLLASVLRVKKGFVRPPKEYLDKSVRGFVQLVTAPQPALAKPEAESWGEQNDAQDQLIVRQQLTRTIEELFKRTADKRRQGKTEQEVETEQAIRFSRALFPSTSANYIKSRKDAGAVSAILENPRVAALRTPGGFVKKTKTPGECIVERLMRKDEEEVVTDLSVYENRAALDQKMRELWRIVREEAIEEQPLAEPVALAEALKARIITKGPPFTHYVLMNVQKDLFGILHTHPAFRLIGSPTGQEDTFAAYVQKRMLSDVKRPYDPEKEFFLSGDYKSSTDYIHSWVSEWCVSEVCRVLGYDSETKDLMIKVLTRHLLEYDGQVRPQTRGQFMGSIVSFPFLCIINAALCRYALEKATQSIQKRRVTPKIKLHKAGLIINGDDCLIRMPRENGGMLTSVNIWRTWTGEVGLTESIGKTLFNSTFAQINSTDFLLENGNFEQVPTVNMGLLMGQKRSGAKSSSHYSQEANFTFGARYRELIRTGPTWMREVLHSTFINSNRAELEKYKIPWFVPEWIGGLGLVGVAQPSELDRRICTRILLNWKKSRPYPLGSKVGEWKIRDLALKGLPEPLTTRDKNNHGIELWDEIVHRRSLNLLLDSRVSLDALFCHENEFKFIKRKLRHNEKLWSLPKNTGLLPKPISLEDLIFRPAYDTITTDYSQPELHLQPFLFEGVEADVSDLDTIPPHIIDEPKDLDEDWPTPDYTISVQFEDDLADVQRQVKEEDSKKANAFKRSVELNRERQLTKLREREQLGKNPTKEDAVEAQLKGSRFCW
jgi:hypothetical protein